MTSFASGRLRVTAAALLLALPLAAAPLHTVAAQGKNEPNVEFEMMTWVEVKAALAAGKTTALFYTGGTEQRGPQNVNGGHNLMGRRIARSIALGLGNAIAMPVLPYTPNNASADLPGTIGLTPEILATVLERLAEQAIATGFKNVVLMGDHGGGQPNSYTSVAEKLSAKYADKGVKVIYCDAVYSKANDDFGKYLETIGLPAGGHGSISDTSIMLYLGGGEWVRLSELPKAEGDPILPRGQRPDPTVPRKNNGIQGDARKASKELGKKAFDQKVAYAIAQIQGALR